MRLLGGTKVVVDGRHGGVNVQDARGNQIAFTSSGMTVSTNGKWILNGQTAEVKASTAKFSGLIAGPKVVANIVLAHAFTPAAGNIF